MPPPAVVTRSASGGARTVKAGTGHSRQATYAQSECTPVQTFRGVALSEKSCSVASPVKLRPGPTKMLDPWIHSERGQFMRRISSFFCRRSNDEVRTYEEERDNLSGSNCAAEREPLYNFELAVRAHNCSWK